MKTFKEVWDSRLNREQIKPGVVVYPVFCPTGSVCHVMPRQIVSESVFTADYADGNEDIGTEFFSSLDGSYIHSLRTNNVVGEEHMSTLSAMFINEDDAKTYAAYISRDEMPEEFKAIRRRLVEKNQERRELAEKDWW